MVIYYLLTLAVEIPSNRDRSPRYFYRRLRLVGPNKRLRAKLSRDRRLIRDDSRGEHDLSIYHRENKRWKDTSRRRVCVKRRML